MPYTLPSGRYGREPLAGSFWQLTWLRRWWFALTVTNTDWARGDFGAGRVNPSALRQPYSGVEIGRRR
ncbi:hypothetical protein ACWEKM_35120 [Streptomyces sp. NPDC004752]